MTGRLYGYLLRACVALMVAATGVSVASAATWVKVPTTGSGAGTWKKFCPSSGPAGTWRKLGPCGAPPVSCTISTHTQNYNVHTQCAASTSSPVAVTLTVNAGVYIWSDSTSQPALTTGALPTGSTFTLVNNGYIIGKGGAGGGYNMPSGMNGENGGSAISLNSPASITTTAGYIAGGGGGGGATSYGAGGACTASAPCYGGGGGAGGGSGGTTYQYNSPYAFAGGAGGGLNLAGGNGARVVCGMGCLGGAGGGGRILPGAGGVTNVDTFGSGGGGGAGGAAAGMSGATYGGSPGGAGSSIGGSCSGTWACPGGGGGWGASGGNGKVYSAYTSYSGGAGGKAIQTNGNSVTWTSGSQPASVYGAVN
jgi:hypothetical protein